MSKNGCLGAVLSKLSRSRRTTNNILNLFWCSIIELHNLVLVFFNWTLRNLVLNCIDWWRWFVDVVRDDPTNNVPDSIFGKLGMQLHRRNQHPLGILKNAIYEYFDTTYPNKFDKFDDLCPIVTVKQVCLWIFNKLL